MLQAGVGSHLHECPPHIQVIHTCRASGWFPQGCDSYPGKHRKKRSINYYRYHLVTTAVTLAVAPAWLLFTAGTQAFWLHTMRMPLASLTFAPSLQISSATCNEIHLRYQLKCKKINIYENIYFDDFEIWQSSHILFYLYKFEIHKIL